MRADTALIPQKLGQREAGSGNGNWDLLRAQATPPEPPEGLLIPAATSALPSPPRVSSPLDFPRLRGQLPSQLQPGVRLSWETPQGRREVRAGAEPLPWSRPPAGLPKAARVSHLKVLQCQAFYQLCGARPDDVLYLALPLYHMSGSLLGVVGCLGIGQSPSPSVLLRCP